VGRDEDGLQHGPGDPHIEQRDRTDAIASDGANIFMAETPEDASSILRFNFATGTEDVYAISGTLADGTTTLGFKFATALALDGSGNLFVGDDPADGAAIWQGRAFKVAPTP
jgi:hypothetical protein